MASELKVASGFVPVTALTEGSRHEGLFTSGTLGRYSETLKELEKHQAHSHEVAGAAAD